MSTVHTVGMVIPQNHISIHRGGSQPALVTTTNKTQSSVAVGVSNIKMEIAGNQPYEDHPDGDYLRYRAV